MKDGILDLLAVGTLMIASRQGEPPSIQTSDMDLESITGMQVCPSPPPPSSRTRNSSRERLGGAGGPS